MNNTSMVMPNTEMGMPNTDLSFNTAIMPGSESTDQSDFSFLSEALMEVAVQVGVIALNKIASYFKSEPARTPVAFDDARATGRAIGDAALMFENAEVEVAIADARQAAHDKLKFDLSMRYRSVEGLNRAFDNAETETDREAVRELIRESRLAIAEIHTALRGFKAS